MEKSVVRKKKMLLIGCLVVFICGCGREAGDQSRGKGVPSGEKFSEASKFEEAGKLTEARKAYRKIFSQSSDPEKIEHAKEKIEDLNIKILFSDLVSKDSALHKVKRGDTLGKLAKKYDTTIELLKKANGLSSNIIRVGEKLKVPTVDFSIVVDKSQNRLFLKKGEEVFKTYLVATGENNSTPTGEFKIQTKLKDPVWFRDDVGAVVPPDSPENILGSRWMGINVSGYGIHGTTEPDKLGQQVTEGCIRMKNGEVEDLFAIVSRGTEVTIVN